MQVVLVDNTMLTVVPVLITSSGKELTFPKKRSLRAIIATLNGTVVATVVLMEIAARNVQNLTYTTQETTAIHVNLAGAGWVNASGVRPRTSASSTGLTANPGPSTHQPVIEGGQLDD